MQQNIFCFTGLGADEKLFSKISIAGFTLKYIQYATPLYSESLPDYAKRLSNQISDVNPILLGVSFGGMLAVEVAKHTHAQKVIIISSVRSATFFPSYYHLANKLHLLRIMPARLFKQPGAIVNYLFGTESADDKTLLTHYIKSADTKFIKWALQQIISWENDDSPANLVHIHGTKDRIIRIPNGIDYTLKNGGHLMIYNRADEISKLLQLCLTAKH